MEYLMFAHAGSKNHGCEAIVRSTTKLLGANQKFTLFSKNKSEDIAYGLNEVVNLRDSPSTDITPRNSLQGYINRIRARLTNSDYDLLESLYRNKPLHQKDAITLSIGGDNYCYSAIIHEMRDITRAMDYWRIPMALWGCSVSSKFMNSSLVEDLRKYQFIAVRESVSQQILEESKANSRIILCCDPAFHLPAQDTKLPFRNENPVIGINVSAFMGYYEAYPNATLLNFKNLILYILKNSDANIALIPHVVHSSDNNDNIPIKLLIKEINNPRVATIDQDLNCMQIKSLVSQCKVFIGCRTHSTIAAYSTLVPTLVAGYSEKAIGIARDLFGDEKGLVIPVQNFTDDHSLTNVYCSFLERELELRERLKMVMPEYKRRVFPAVNALKELAAQI